METDTEVLEITWTGGSLDSEMLEEPELWLITESNTSPTLVLTLQWHKSRPVICAMLAQHWRWWYAGATKQCIIDNII